MAYVRSSALIGASEWSFNILSGTNLHLYRIFLQSGIKMIPTHIQKVSLNLLFAMAAAFGPTPAFEVASIKKAEPLNVNNVMSGQMHLGMTVDAAMVKINALSVTELLRMAYKVKSFQISGPDWLGVQRFDITAKMPAGATRDQVPEMVQALLADRFKLTLHRSTTEQSVYALEIAKGGLKLQESPPDSAVPAADSAGPSPAEGGPEVRANVTSTTQGVVSGSGTTGNYKMIPSQTGMRMELTKMTAAGIVEILGRFVDRPIVDMTDLKGKYDLTLEVGMEDMIALARAAGMNVQAPQADTSRAAEPGSSSIFAAIQQYGLKLEPRRAPVELLVIDHVEKEPTEN
jgi:uncharacterized protein (TIGR03435 family)